MLRYSDIGNHRAEDGRAVDHRHRTWDAGREGTFRREACMDIRVEGHCIVRDSLHLRILAAAGTAVVVPDPGQAAGTEADNTLVAGVVGAAAAASVVVQGDDRGEGEEFLVLHRGALRDVVGENREDRES
jgi:hypothetical protein